MRKNIFENSYFKTIFNIFSWTFSVLLFLVACILFIYVLYTNIVSKDDKHPLYSIYTIISGSMEPSININDVVVNKRVDDPSTLKVGDIITYYSTSSLNDGYTITHRIINIVNDDDGLKFITKGDNNLSQDNFYVLPGNIVGKEICIIPKLGLIQNFLINASGWVILVILPAIGIVIYDIIRVIKVYMTMKKVEEVTTEVDDIDHDKQKLLKQQIINRLSNYNGVNSNIRNKVKMDDSLDMDRILSKIEYNDKKTKD